MEQKYFVASKGNCYLTLTTHPGTLTEQDILKNLERMASLEEDSAPRQTALSIYSENLDRIMELANPGTDLIQVEDPKSLLEDLEAMPLHLWQETYLPRTEWD